MEVLQQKEKRKQFIFAGVVVLVVFAGFILSYLYGKPVILIDAGHGGADVGAVGVISEVELTEPTAEALKQLFKEDGRFRPVLSRKAGEGMSIDARNRKFRHRFADLVLSIHGNAEDYGTGSGFECYPSPPSCENHGESMELARLLTEEMAAEGAMLRGSNGIKFGYYDENGSKMLVDSKDTQSYGYNTFGVLQNLRCPAVLAEQCFVTNAADVRSFGTAEGCQRAAEAYYRAICRYFEETE